MAQDQDVAPESRVENADAGACGIAGQRDIRCRETVEFERVVVAGHVEVRDDVAFRNEMIHETRIIPLDGRAPLPATVKSYMGVSRGHFEGNTLVVRTTNLNGKTGMQGNGMMLIPSDALVLEERFTPLSANILQYEVTINDPRTWSAPWKVSFPLRRDNGYQMFEYACHEGNYAMRNTLSGSRADEKAPQAK